MNAVELRKMPEDQLLEKMKILHQEAFNLRFRHATNQLQNTSRVRQVRREIARIKTIVGARLAEGKES